MNRLWRHFALAASLAACCLSGFSQTAEQPVVLIIEVDNYVFYRGDVTDSTKLARDPGPTAPLPGRAFQYSQGIGDIVAVNGQPAKGLWHNRNAVTIPRVNPQPGEMIADYSGTGSILCTWQILGSDGTPVGSLWTGAGIVSPSQVFTILAGSGAFLGVTGEHRVLETIRPSRNASVTEDPANRRIHGGGKMRFVFYLFPKYRPSVDVTADGPAVFRVADFSLVTAARPARAGEILTVAARHLGPVRPDLLPPGARPFKADPVEMVNSPIEVTVGGKEAEVINRIGWPGTYDLYRVDFRVPSGLAPGMAKIQLTAAWIPGPEVQIPVQ